MLDRRCMHQFGGNVIHFTEGVAHRLVLCLFHRIACCSFQRCFLSFHSFLPDFLLLTLNSSGIHTEKSILPALSAFGREHGHI